MSSGGGARAVVTALAANLGIAASKFAGFVITGSTSMLAEGVHSVADSGNQVLLLFGARQARRGADERHPFGYGQDRFFYAFVVALVLFTLGGAFAIWEGVGKVHHPHHLDEPAVAIAILGIAVVLEAVSLRSAVREARQVRGGASYWQFIRHTANPELAVLLLEDTAALTGLGLALLGVALTLVTGNPVFDGASSIAIGVLLALVAALLAVESKSLLIGEGVRPAERARIVAALTGGAVDRVIHLRTMYLGPEELLVAAKVAMPPGLALAEVAEAIDAAEAALRAALPVARVVYLEPDVDRGTGVPPRL